MFQRPIYSQEKLQRILDYFIYYYHNYRVPTLCTTCKGAKRYRGQFSELRKLFDLLPGFFPLWECWEWWFQDFKCNFLPSANNWRWYFLLTSLVLGGKHYSDFFYSRLILPLLEHDIFCSYIWLLSDFFQYDILEIHPVCSFIFIAE